MKGPENILCKLLGPDQEGPDQDPQLVGSDLDPTFFLHLNSVA